MDVKRTSVMVLGAIALGVALFGSSAAARRHAPAYTSSVQVPHHEHQERGTGKDERSEAAQLASLTRIDMAQATAAALAQVPGAVVKAELDNENGNVVYSVEILTSMPEVKEVKVDAGTGQVLHIEAGGTSEDEEDD